MKVDGPVESICVCEMKDMEASFSGLQHRFPCICEVFLWYKRREEGNWKEKCQVKPLNSQRGNERWWVVTIHPSTKNVLPLRWPSIACSWAPSQLYHFTTGLWLENIFWSVQDPTKQPFPVWDLSPWAASTFEPHCWASDQDPQENIGKP